jgi:trehalose 6-phosphate synthase
MMREAGFRGRIGFFLHTPFPDLAIAERFLDSRGRDLLATIVGAMLGSDLVGLQTEGDCERLAAAATALCGATAVAGGVRINGRVTRIAAHPVGIDVEEVLDAARTFDVPAQARRALLPGLPLVVGLERCDFTKGIPERLRAVAGAMAKHGPFAYVGIASPTRPGVEAYTDLQIAIAGAASEACAAAETTGGTFVHLGESVPWGEVVALQREADVVFTSSLADGMNIVPLQAVAAQSLRPCKERAVIITGRDAGVASAFPGYAGDGLVAVDPLDPAQMTAALGEALAGRPARISDRLIEDVRRRDAFAWATRFLTDLEESQC